MNVSPEQKKIIKKNLYRLSLKQIAEKTNLSEQVLQLYLENLWGKEKLNRFLIRTRQISETEKSNLTPVDLKGFLQKNYLSLIFLVILVFIAYANGLNNGFTSDDILAIPKNPDNRRLVLVDYFSVFNLRAFIYYFVANVFGIHALYYRIFNILYHVGTVVCLYLFIGLFFSTQLALFASALVAVHPFFIESVTWLSGGHYAFSGWFCFLSLLLYIYSNKKQNNLLYGLALLLFMCALAILNKVMSFPAIVLLYEFCFGDLKKNWKKVVGYFVIALYFIINAALQINSRQISVAQESYMPVIKPNFFIQLPVALTSYFYLLFWPDKLSLYQSELNFSVFQFVVRLIIFFGYCGISIYSFFKNKFIFFWLAFFVIALSPTLTPFGVGWIFAERYGYLGTIGIIVVFAWFLTEIAKNERLKPVIEVIFIALIIALIVRTIVRNIDWKDEDHLWLATGRVAQSSPSTHNNLGDVYARQGNYQKALEEFFTVLRLNPNHADATHNIGNVYHMMGNDQKAIEFYLKALKMNPKLWQTNQNLAIIYFSSGKLSEADKYMEKALNYSPRNSDLYTTYGIMRYTIGKKDEAKSLLQKALELNPDNDRAKSFIDKINQEHN